MPVLSRSDAAHLHGRVGFGASPAELDAFTGMERATAVDRVLDFSASPAAARPIGVDHPMSQWGGWVVAVDWWVKRMVSSSAPLEEKLTLFWHSHFATQASKTGEIALLIDQQMKLRELGLGDYAALCTAIATDTAMLIQLDNHANVRDAPQENFARELMELFTIGVGNFTEADVRAMARAWTGHGFAGWTAAGWDWSYGFHPDRHDATIKTLFGKAAAWNGPETIHELVHGSMRPVCARFMAAKFLRWLVHPAPDPALIEEIGAAFERSSMRIDGLLRAILSHEQFWAPGNRNALVKDPVEFVVGMLRRTNVSIEKAWVQSALSWMGQVLFDPPSVRGWEDQEDWLSTAAVCARGSWLRHLRWETNGMGRWSDLTTQAPAVAARRAFTDLGVESPSPATLRAFERWFAEAVAADARPVPGKALVFAGMAPEVHVK